MASSSDGSIRIDTELDNSGFDKGSDKLINALKDLKNSVDAIGSTLGSGLDSVIKSLQALSSQAAAANQQVGQSAQQAAAANQQVGQSAQQATQAMQTMAAAPRNISTEYSSIGRTAASLHDQIMQLSTAAEIGFKSDGQILRFRDNVEVVARKTQELRMRLDALASTRTPTEGYAFLQSEVDKTDKALQRLLDRQQKMDDTGASRSSAAYKRLQYDIENASRAISTMKAEMSDMEVSGEAFTLGSNTAEYQNMSGILSSIENELSGVQEKSSAAQLSLSSFSGTHPILAAVAGAAKKAGSALLTMGKAIAKKAVHAFSSAIKALGKGLKAVASGAKRAISGLLGFNRTAKAGASPVKGLVKGLTSFKTMLLSRIKETFMTQVYNSLQEGVQKFASYSSAFNTAMSNIKNSCGQIGGQIASLFANVLTVIEPVLTRILSLINSIITAISALFAKLTGKNTVAVAAKSTQSYAAGLDSAAGSAGNAAKEQKKFNAELYGWDELTRQSEPQEDSGGGGGGGGASGPTWTEVPVDDILKDWEDIDWFQVGYDWAEKLADALDSIPWGKIQKAAYRLGNNLAELMNGVFANLHLANSLGNTIAQALNTGLSLALGFLENFDFSQFGIWAGTLWNAFVNGFDFNKLAGVIEIGGNGIITSFTTFFRTIASTCETLGGGLAEIFNSIFSGIDFGKLADAILLGVNDVNLALKGFNDGVDWQGAAQNILNGANKLIRGMALDENGNLTNVWAENGTEIGRLIGGFVNHVHTIVSGLDYKALGENLGLWFTNAINEIDFNNLLDSIVQFFNGVVNGLGAFIGSMDWGGIGSKIAKSLLNAIKNIDWAGIGTTIGNQFVGALELLNGFIGDMNWSELGKSILSGLITMLANIDWVSLIGNLFELLVGVLEGAVELLLGSISGIFDGLAKAFKGIGGDIVAGLFQGISDGFSGIAAWLKEHVFNPIVNTVKSLFGINSPSTVFAEMGDYLVQGLLKGLSGAWDSITGWFKDVLGGIKEKVTGAWDSIKEKTSKAWENIKSGISKKWDGIKTKASTSAESIKTKVTTAWENIKTKTSTKWEEIKTGLSGAWENIKTTARESAGNVKTKVTTAWGDLRTNTAMKWEGIKTSIQNKFNSAKTTVMTAAGKMKERTLEKWKDMVSGAREKFKSIYDTCKDKMSSATEYLKGIEWGSIGTNLVKGLLNGLKTAWKNVTEWANKATTKLTQKVKDILGIASPSKEWAKIGVFLDEGLTEGLQSGERSLMGAASDLAAGLTDRMAGEGGTMQLTSDADIARLDAVAGKLSRIAAIIDHISAAIASMGGLQIPQIAAGTVAPYRTRAAAAKGEGYDADGGMDGYTMEAVQLLRNIRDYLAVSGNNKGSGDIKIVIDGREVFKAVVKENNRAITRSGGVSPLRV